MATNEIEGDVLVRPAAQKHRAAFAYVARKRPSQSSISLRERQRAHEHCAIALSFLKRGVMGAFRRVSLSTCNAT
jgi:hypothetical protein